MVFHRFIEGVPGRPRLRLLVNGEKVQAWNPFAPAERQAAIPGHGRHQVNGKPVDRVGTLAGHAPKWRNRLEKAHAHPR